MTGIVKRLLSFLLSGTGLLLSACTAASDTGSSPTPAPVKTAPPAASAGFSASAALRRPERRRITVKIPQGEIGGILYVPPKPGRLPLIILSHGLGASHLSLEDWAEDFADRAGCAAFCFDFRGCGSLSSGTSEEMSVMTEADDVSAVLSAARSWDFVDPDKIVLLGESQGGVASAIAAARYPQDIAALILLYPAFVIPDHLHEQFSSPEEVPEVFTLFGIPLGRRYALDLWDCDVYSEIRAYDGPVLLIHGTADQIVPFSYSQKALEVYPDARLIAAEGAGHGFFSERARAFEDMTAFLQSVGI